MAKGRPTDYREDFAEQAFNYCLLGATDKDLAQFFDVDERTINRWKKDHDAFCQSVKRGKEQADADVARSLYDKAQGGDTTAMIFWLKNRQKEKWRDKQETEITGKDGGPIEFSDTERAARLAALLDAARERRNRQAD